MRMSRVALISALLVAPALLFVPAGHTDHSLATVRETAPAFSFAESRPALVSDYHGPAAANKTPAATADQGGIRELVPEKFAARYQQWKKEFLSTETGQEQWKSYQDNRDFTLTIVVARDNPEGGTTSSYKWDQTGQLVAATITLGYRLDAGVPNPVYFPVMNSLLFKETARRIDGQTLAATKMAHEFGHVNRTAKGDSQLYQLQGQLMPKYNEIFLANGRDARDPRLVELAQKMGGTPVEIWEDREYWGETNAMLYLRDRFAEDSFRCQLFSRIKRSIDLYAPSYEERFLSIAQSTVSGRHCDW